MITKEIIEHFIEFHKGILHAIVEGGTWQEQQAYEHGWTDCLHALEYAKDAMEKNLFDMGIIDEWGL